MEAIKTTNSKENLCDTCHRKKDFPQCLSGDVIFGDGIGNDNIIQCSQYTGLVSDTRYKIETETLENGGN